MGFTLFLSLGFSSLVIVQLGAFHGKLKCACIWKNTICDTQTCSVLPQSSIIMQIILNLVSREKRVVNFNAESFNPLGLKSYF